MSGNRKYKLIALCFCILSSLSAHSQEVENDFQTRAEIKLGLFQAKKWKFSLTPEFRFDETFSVDKYLLEIKGEFAPSKLITLGASYRFIGNARENNPTEYLHRFAFDAEVEQTFKRWEPSFRLRYTNYSEDIADGEFLRYKAALNYDIKGSKLTPLISAEAYHELSNKEFYKMRYAVGFKYKLNKKNAINIGYKLDYYLNEYSNKHILYLSYKIKF